MSLKTNCTKDEIAEYFKRYIMSLGFVLASKGILHFSSSDYCFTTKDGIHIGVSLDKDNILFVWKVNSGTLREILWGVIVESIDDIDFFFKRSLYLRREFFPKLPICRVPLSGSLHNEF